MNRTCGTRAALAMAAGAMLAATLLVAAPSPAASSASEPVPRILGGAAADPAATPFAAAILFKDRFICSGSLVGPRHVVTAGHCAQDKLSNLTVVTGRPDLRNLAVGQVSGIVAKYVHPDFEKKGVHDLAVFGLTTPSPSPTISIAQNLEGNALTVPGQPLTVAGWGATTPFQDKPPGFLKSTLVNAVNKKQCGKVYGRGFIGSAMICAKGAQFSPGKKRSLRTSPCPGDSGGPLFGTLPTTGESRLVGLVSFGPRICGLPFAPVSYAKTFDPSGLEFLGGAIFAPLP